MDAEAEGLAYAEDEAKVAPELEHGRAGLGLAYVAADLFEVGGDFVAVYVGLLCNFAHAVKEVGFRLELTNCA